MPRYTILFKDTDEESDIECTYEDLLKVLEDKKIQQVFKPIMLAYRIGKLPISEDFRSRLKKIKKNSPGSNMNIP